MRPERGVGFGGSRRLLGHPLSNSMERANPSIFTAGPPSKDGCQRLRSSAKKTNKGTFKNPGVKGCFGGVFSFFFSFFLLPSANPPRSQLMISLPLSHQLGLRGTAASAGFRSGSRSPRLRQSPLPAGWSRRWSSGSRCCRSPPSFLSASDLCRLHRHRNLLPVAVRLYNLHNLLPVSLSHLLPLHSFQAR